MISDETGKKFQVSPLFMLSQKWPQLVACERNYDGGLDAHASGELAPDGGGVGLACSITATLTKVQDDAADTKKNYPDVRVLIFFDRERSNSAYGGALGREGPRQVVVCSLWRSARRVHHLAARSGELRTSAEINWESLRRWRRSSSLRWSIRREAAKEIADNWDRRFRRGGTAGDQPKRSQAERTGLPVEGLTTASLNTVLTEATASCSRAPPAAEDYHTRSSRAGRADCGRAALLVDLPIGCTRTRKFFVYVPSGTSSRSET